MRIPSAEASRKKTYAPKSSRESLNFTGNWAEKRSKILLSSVVWSVDVKLGSVPIKDNGVYSYKLDPQRLELELKYLSNRVEEPEIISEKTNPTRY